MEALFLQILSMSMSASWLIIAVIIIRFLLKKAPKGFRYVLWALVAVRLLCPIFIESDFSLVPMTPGISDGDNVILDDEVQNDNIQNNDVQNQTPQGNQGQINNIESIILPDNETQDNTSQDSVIAEKKNPSTVMSWIWSGGILVLFAYAVVSYGLLRNTVKASVQKEDNLWVCDGIQSPFILGLFHPQIYLPSYIDEKHIPYIVAHEKEHIRFKDNWWKPLGFVLLTIHWFNPFVWLAYILMCKDIELACDERVIRSMNADDKKNYSKSLLLCSNPKHFISACPVAFGEVGVKERIKKIVDYRKPSVWIIGIGIVVCLIMAVGFMTNPKAESKGIAKIMLQDGPLYTEITDSETIKQIVSDMNDLVMIPVFPSLPSGGWSYWIKMYDADGNIIDDLTLLSEDTIKGEYFIYKTINGTFDTDYFDWLIENYEVEMKDHLNSMEGEIELSQKELEWFATEFFNNDENRIINMFLTSTYINIKNIDLAKLFYCGADGYGTASVTDEEKQLLAQEDGYAQGSVYELDVAKTTTQEMDEVLEKYTGYPLAGVNQKNLHTLYYLKEYKAYYNIAGDTLMTKYVFEKGWKKDDGDIVLQYTDALNGDGTEKYIVTLRPVDGSYHFVSNASLSGDNSNSDEILESGVSKEQLDWFETEYFNQEDNQIRNQFLTSSYEFPVEIDLYELFYNGAGGNIIGGSDIPSEDEKNLILDYFRDAPFTDLIRITREDMDDVLQKYMAITLDETNKVGLDKMYYLEKYDVYYMMHGDTNYARYVFEKGSVNEDGTITLQYHDMDNGDWYLLTLTEENGEYHFVSNIRIVDIEM